MGLQLPRVVLSRDGSERGVPTGRVYPCCLEGCSGLRIVVKWPDGKVTHPCSAGMKEVEKGVWKII